ncbi:KN motif and ankyrin repeat domain-containing protein 1-like isoform X2 [Ptychodera flava]|uniref:KN motif and ankyrin repeat domain-containing protein 1-like isoform X2 n=1 Tax=Ptychodera flava TaxID=63121 RepID=UPI00396A6A30
MALSLQRLKELEEQVKNIPILQVKINVLKEEKRLLTMQLKSRKNKQRSVGVGDADVNSSRPNGEVKYISSLHMNKPQEVSVDGSLPKDPNRKASLKTAATQADIIIADKRKDNRSVGVQVTTTFNANNNVPETEVIQRQYQTSLSSERVVVSNSNSSSPTRDLKFFQRRQLNAPFYAKETCDTGVGFINVNKVECEKCRGKQSRTLGVGDADVREILKVQRQMTSVGVEAAIPELKAKQISVGVNTKPKVVKDKAIDMSITTANMATNTPPPVRKSKASLTDKIEHQTVGLNTELTKSDLSEKKQLADSAVNTDYILRCAKAVNTDLAPKQVEIRQIRKPPRPMRHVGINTISADEWRAGNKKATKDIGVGKEQVNFVDSGNNPEPLPTAVKSVNTVPLVRKSMATLTEKNTSDVSCNTMQKVVKDKAVVANISKPSFEKGVETEWIRMSIATNTPHKVTQETGTNYESYSHDVAMETEYLGCDATTNTAVRETHDQGNNTVSKEYQDVATGDDTMCLNMQGISVGVGDSSIEPEVIAAEAEMVQQTFNDEQADKKELCDVAVGDGKTSDVVCDICGNKKSRTVAVGVCSVKDTICDRCTNMKSRTIGVSNCTIEDTLCPDCKEGKSTKPCRTVGCGSCSVHDILCYKCAMMNCVNKAVGDRKITDAVCNICDKIPRRHIGVGVGSVDDIICDKCQMFNFVNQAVGDCTIDDRVCDHCDNLVTVDAAVDPEVSMNQYETVAIGDRDVRHFDVSLSTEAVSAVSVAIETDKIQMESTGTGEGNVSTGTVSSLTEMDTRTVAMETEQVTMASTATGTEQVVLRNVGSGTEPIIHISSGVGDGYVNTANVGTESVQAETQSVSVSTEKVQVANASTDAYKVPVRTSTTETEKVPTADSGVGGNAVTSTTKGTATDVVTTATVGVGDKSVERTSTGSVTDAVATTEVGVGSRPVQLISSATETDVMTTSTVGVGSEEIVTKSVATSASVPTLSVSVLTEQVKHSSIGIGEHDIRINPPAVSLENASVSTTRSNNVVTRETTSIVTMETPRMSADIDDVDTLADINNIAQQMFPKELESREPEVMTSTSHQLQNQHPLLNHGNHSINPDEHVSKEVITVRTETVSSYEPIDGENFSATERDIANSSFENRYAIMAGSSPSQSESLLRTCIKNNHEAKVHAGNKAEYGFVRVNGNVGFELGDELGKALAVLEKHLEKPGGLDAKEVAACVSVIAQEWFRISSQKDASTKSVADHVRAIQEMSKGVLEKVVNLADGNGNTSLHYCVSHGNFAIVNLLLDTSVCDPNKQNKAGYTPIMLASLAILKDEQQKVAIQKLFKMGNVNIRATQAGQTALMLAVSHGRLDMVKLLLESKADVNMQDEDGSTALMCASEHGHLEIVKLLLAQPECNPNLFDNDGSSALAIAMEAGHRDIGVLLYAQMNFSKNSSPSLSRARIKGSPSPTRRIPSSPTTITSSRMSPAMGRRSPSPRTSPLPSPSHIPLPRRNSTGSANHSYTSFKERREQQQQKRTVSAASTAASSSTTSVTSSRRTVTQTPRTTRPSSAGSTRATRTVKGK